MYVLLLFLLSITAAQAQSPASTLADDLHQVVLSPPGASADPLRIPTVDRDVARDMRQASLWLDSLALDVAMGPVPTTYEGRDERRKWTLQFDRAALAYRALSMRMQRDLLRGRDVTRVAYSEELGRAAEFRESIPASGGRFVGAFLERLGRVALDELGVTPRLKRLWQRVAQPGGEESDGLRRSIQEREELAATLERYLVFDTYDETVARVTNQ